MAQADGTVLRTWPNSAIVPASVRVPSFVEAVTLAHNAGKVVAFGFGRNRRITLPGLMTPRAAKGASSSAADALSQIE